MNTARRLVCEFLGTAFLLATVVGSGILAHKLDAGNTAVAVMAVAISTGCVLTALILSFGGISAHFNPIVTVATAIRKELDWSLVSSYIMAQVAGAIAGVCITNLMFDLPAVMISQTPRTGTGQWLGEFVATFGLLGIIFGCARFRGVAIPAAVGCYVCGAIWFTSSTCFANPAVTIARVFTDTLTGIRPVDVFPYIVSQSIATASALALFGWLFAAEDKPSSLAKDLARFTSKPPVSGAPSGRESSSSRVTD
ncbi:MAG TPA: MIP/aquaporin family protein [Candidatus Obscuribacterales bacterium]